MADEGWTQVQECDATTFFFDIGETKKQWWCSHHVLTDITRRCDIVQAEVEWVWHDAIIQLTST